MKQKTIKTSKKTMGENFEDLLLGKELSEVTLK